MFINLFSLFCIYVVYFYIVYVFQAAGISHLGDITEKVERDVYGKS